MGLGMALEGLRKSLERALEGLRKSLERTLWKGLGMALEGLRKRKNSGRAERLMKEWLGRA